MKKKKDAPAWMELIDRIAAGDFPAAASCVCQKKKDGGQREGGLRGRIQTRAKKIQKSYRRVQTGRALVSGVIRLAEKLL